MINARSETAHLLPAFRDAMKSRRCLIPANGFYEWLRKGTAKQPFWFEVRDGELFAVAGLWERWRNPAGGWNMRSYPICNRINQVSNDDPECVLRTEIVEAQDCLF